MHFDTSILLLDCSALNPIQLSVKFHREISHLFCRAKQMTGIYMIRNTGLKLFNPFRANIPMYLTLYLLVSI